jgi:hypothetical protein
MFDQCISLLQKYAITLPIRTPFVRTFSTSIFVEIKYCLKNGQVGWLERNIPAQHRKIQYCLLDG